MNLVWRMPIGSASVAQAKAFGLDASASSRQTFEDGILTGYMRYANSLGIEGMRSVDPSVSNEFHEKYPGKYFQKTWLDLPPHWVMHPDHPMFEEYIRTQMRLTNEREGVAHGWGTGWFAEQILRHEDGTQMKGEEQAQVIQRLAGAISKAILKEDPQAYGVMGDSTFISGPQWDAESARAFFKAFDPRFKVMVYGVYHEWNAGGRPPSYKQYDYYYGARWAFGVLHSMAGNTWLHGDLAGLIRQLRQDVWGNPKGKNCVGLFILPEVVHYNTLYFELAADLQWDPTRVALGEFLDDYCLRRYGSEGARAMRKAFDHLLASSYGTQRRDEPAYCGRPMSVYDKFDLQNPFAYIDVGRIRTQEALIPELEDALRAALTVPAGVQENPLYLKDLVDIARHVVALLYNQYYLRAAAAYGRRDRADFAANGQKMKELLALQERLLHSNPWFWMQRTIDMAARLPIFGGKQGAPRAVRAKHMWISDQGKTSIHLLDYYRQDLYELVRDYYSVRVARFLQVLGSHLGDLSPEATEKELKAAYEEVENTYLEHGGPAPEPPQETPVEAARAVLAALPRYWPVASLRMAEEKSVRWSFDDAEGRQVEAATGGNRLSLVGEQTWRPEGLAGGCLDLAPGRAAVLADMDQKGLDVKYDLTLEAWVHLRDLPPPGQSYPLIYKSRGSGDQRAYGLAVRTGRQGHSAVQFFVSNDGTANTWPYRGGGIVGVQSRVPPPVGTWFHLAAVFRSGQDLTIYLDGKSVGVLQSVGTGNVPPSIHDSPAAFMVGARDDGHGEPQAHCNALIDEVRVSNFARYTGPFEPKRPQ